MPKTAPLPRTYAPQLATLARTPPEGGEWLHEMKYDGYRIGCRIDGARVTLLSRNGKDWTGAFPEIVDAARKLRVKRALFDGEVCVVLPDGRTSFQALQNASSAKERRGLVYFAFDLLHLDGENVAALPLSERKMRLASIRGIGPRGRIRRSEHIEGRGRDVFAQACRLGAEGIVSKRRDAPYRAGRRAEWIKTKCVRRQEFVVGGFTDPEGARKGIGSVLVGYYAGKRLVFAGKVGTGFTQRGALDLRRTLENIETNASPFQPPPAGWLGRHAHWVKPRLVAEVVFTEWTSDGKIRHPSFQGLREDKTATDVVREDEPSPTSISEARTSRDAAQDVVAGVKLTHGDRVLFTAARITKSGLARYYESIADWVLPHLEGRPLTLVRCPEGASGECFYMKHSKVWAPKQVRRVRIQEKKKIGDYLIADDLPALVSLVQMGVLEIHTWNSRFARVEQPDRVIFDIDPGPAVEWPEVISAARLVRSVLEELELQSFVKNTGSRGFHVVVPLRPERNWSECLAFSRALAERIAAEDPGRFTTAFAKAGRERKILIDYLRNNRTNTSISAFSTRRKPHAPVSMTLAWEELDPEIPADHYTVLTAPERLSALKRDPWRDYWGNRQRLSAAAYRAVVVRSS
jgi:bifunctional non-homologous end joining protein LigD